MIYVLRLTHTQQESNISFAYSIWYNVIWIHILEQKSTGTVTWSCRSAQVRYQFAVMRSFIVTFHKSQTVLRTGAIGNIVLKRYTLKPVLAFPQNLASPQNLAWHFWPGLRFGLLKNVGLKLKKGSLHIVSDFFHRIFIAFLGYWKLNAFLTPIQPKFPSPAEIWYQPPLPRICYLVSPPK